MGSDDALYLKGIAEIIGSFLFIFSDGTDGFR